MCTILSATLHVHFIHGQLLVHLYALLSCHAASVKCFYKSCFLWQINDDDDDDVRQNDTNFTLLQEELNAPIC